MLKRKLILSTIIYFLISLNFVRAQDTISIPFNRFTIGTSLSQLVVGDYELGLEYRLSYKTGFLLSAGYYRLSMSDVFGANFARMNSGEGYTVRLGMRDYFYKHKNLHQNYERKNPSFLQFQMFYRNDHYDQRQLYIDGWFIGGIGDEAAYNIESATQNILGFMTSYGKQFNTGHVNIELIGGFGVKLRVSKLNIYEKYNYGHTDTFPQPNYVRDKAATFAMMLGLNISYGFKKETHHIVYNLPSPPQREETGVDTLRNHSNVDIYNIPEKTNVFGNNSVHFEFGFLTSAHNYFAPAIVYDHVFKNDSAKFALNLSGGIINSWRLSGFLADISLLTGKSTSHFECGVRLLPPKGSYDSYSMSIKLAYRYQDFTHYGFQYSVAVFPYNTAQSYGYWNSETLFAAVGIGYCF